VKVRQYVELRKAGNGIGTDNVSQATGHTDKHLPDNAWSAGCARQAKENTLDISG
jgi:hypothetical protein